MSQTELAERIHVSYPRVNEIINGRRGVTPDTALRLARLFGTSPEFWLNGQRNWDLWHALHSGAADELNSIEPVPWLFEPPTRLPKSGRVEAERRVR